MKALNWNHRFPWNDTGNPFLYTCNHSRLTENEILNCGIWNRWFSHILWAPQISLLAILLSLHQHWKTGISSGVFSLLFCVWHNTIQENKIIPWQGKYNVKQQLIQKKILHQGLTVFSWTFTNAAGSCSSCLNIYWTDDFCGRMVIFENSLTLFKKYKQRGFLFISINPFKWEWTDWRKYQIGAVFSKEYEELSYSFSIHISAQEAKSHPDQFMCRSTFH